MILVAAAAKSAQLPFSTWLPRAMEGPTPSSAIFYGSMSVHIGVFLLLRTFPFWEHQVSVRILIALLGLATALLATGMARVQSSVKSQIAYSSIAQIGLIFIEIALGLKYIALIHFAGNAFLRTYQLLVSPSVVTYQIREQFYHFVPRQQSIEDSWPKRFSYSIYMLCLKEWNLDSFMYHYLWQPIKWFGNRLGIFTSRRAILFFLPTYAAGITLLIFRTSLPQELIFILPGLFSIIGLAMVFKSFTERIHARMSWILVIMNHFWVALAISLNEQYSFSHTLLYLSGISVFGLVGYFTLRTLKQREGSIDLHQFHGHVHRHPKLAFLFLVASLAVSGFPITPTFIGEDLIFMHIHEHQYLLAFFTSLSFIVDGLAIIRIYARTFMGPHVKSVYDMAYRSS
jgi:NADH:ubiquinone oxidoreductase subunit 5 (subunit L)/multisubunit Na+/H+ antiporter MnhA subunit